MNDSISAIYQYSASCLYSPQNYLRINDENKIVVDQKKTTSLTDLVSKILSIYNTCETENKILLRESIKVIQSKLKNKLQEKTSRIINYVISPNTTELTQAIEQIDVILNEDLSNAEINEKVYLLKFFTTIPQHLKVTIEPTKETRVFQWSDGSNEKVVVDEWQIIEWLSHQVFQSNAVQSQPDEKRWNTYYEIMLGAYSGDHILIEDDENHSKTKEFEQFGAVIRASSHCESGRAILGWNDDGHPRLGGDSHQDLLKADTPHKGITGRHIKHILFYPIDMRMMKTGELIYAKTARQVDRLAAANNLYVKGQKVEASELDLSKEAHFLALQFEYAPDSEGFNLFDSKFYQHRVYSFLTYIALKTFGFVHANIGPYGYGRTDENPVIIKG